MLRSRVIYLVLLLGAIGFYVFFGRYIAFAAVVFVLILPLFLYAITLITSKKIKVKFGDCETIAQKLSPQQIEITLDNESMFHIATARLTIINKNEFSNEKSKELIVVPINANQVTTIKTGVVSQYCGNVQLIIKKIKLYDFLSLTSYTKQLNVSLRLSVLPNVYEIGSNANILIAPDDESHSYSTTKSGDDSSQVFDYHEYHDGDKMKNIHWKLSTKLDRLMVKELSQPISSTVCIALELGACENLSNRFLQIDAQMDTLTSISSWLFFGGISHEIEWYNPVEACGENMRVSSIDDLFLVIEHLYHTQPHLGNMLLDEIANRTAKMIFSHSIYITNAITDNTIKQLFALKEKVDVSLIYIKQEGTTLANDIKQALDVVEINLIEVNATSIESDLQKLSFS